MTAPPLEVYFDGECPLCRREVAWLEARTSGETVRYIDFTEEGFDFAAVGASREQLMGRIHARDADGFVTGVEVFRRVYEAAGLGWLVAPTRWPLLAPACEAAYRLFARHRLRLTGRSGGPVHRLTRRVELALDTREAFDFFCDPANLESITPPALRFRITEAPELPLRAGSEIAYSLRLRGVPFRWRTRIGDWRPGVGFVDTALRSPYASWRHRHTLNPLGAGRCEMIDEVEYRLPFPPMGEWTAGFVHRELERIFDWREQTLLARFGQRRKAA